nr:AMP-binding protein [Bacillus velezensis]
MNSSFTKFCGGPSVKIEEMELLTRQEEKEQSLTPLSGGIEKPEYETIHTMFERQAAQTPQEIAIQYEGAEISYKELNETANKLARILRKRGVKHQEPVAVIAGRSPSLAIAVLGILKAGGAIVPIDPSHPAERIRYIIENSSTLML